MFDAGFMREAFAAQSGLPLNPGWEDVCLRLAATIAACGLIGLDREARGHAAGLKTTVLVGLAAAVAMIQANLLLGSSGKTAQSFVEMDVMRLPLGILTGVGFIGGGAILRRGHRPTGLTTAATLWAVTVIGLCFGGGQIALGAAATLATLVVLVAFALVDHVLPRKQAAMIALRAPFAPATVAEIKRLAARHRVAAQLRRVSLGDGEPTLSFEIEWMRLPNAGPPLALLEELHRSYPVASFERRSDS